MAGVRSSDFAPSIVARGERFGDLILLAFDVSLVRLVTARGEDRQFAAVEIGSGERGSRDPQRMVVGAPDEDVVIADAQGSRRDGDDNGGDRADYRTDDGSGDDDPGLVELAELFDGISERDRESRGEGTQRGKEESEGDADPPRRLRR